MYIDPRIVKWMQDMYVFMTRQQEKIERIEQFVAEMREELKEIKNQRTTHVEKVEYNFDQLKVETLEGTLNIGLSPNGKEIDELVLPHKGEQIVEEQPAYFFPKLKEQLDRYIDLEFPGEVQMFETNYGIELSDEIRHAILEDIRNQVGPRIMVYMKMLYNGTEEETVEKDILDRVKRDIRIATEQYFDREFGKKELGDTELGKKGFGKDSEAN